MSDGREFNGEDDFSASVYRGNAKASCAAEIDHFHIGDTALFSGDSGRSRIYSGRHVPAKYPGNGEAGAMAVPLMISASETAEELSAAAVTRGIENPAPKTSIIRLHMGPFDWIYVALSIVFAAAAIIM